MCFAGFVSMPMISASVILPFTLFPRKLGAPPEEVSAIMELLREYLFEAEERKKENAARGMRIRFIGSQEGLPGDIIS